MRQRKLQIGVGDLPKEILSCKPRIYVSKSCKIYSNHMLTLLKLLLVMS